MPGPFDYVNGIALFERVEKYESLYGANIVKEMRTRLGVDDRVKFRFINDATSFAIAEAWIGKARDFRRVVALTLGTGFGSAFLIGGIPVIEGDSVPGSGCVWHIPFRDGIADDYFSTRWFVSRYETITGKRVPGVKEIADVFDTDIAAQEVFQEYGANMGEFLAPWLKQFDAEIIVIGGNVSAAFPYFGEVFSETLLKNGVGIEIRISGMMENAAIIGSSRLIEEDFWENVKGLLSKM
jgi:glucokinase